MDPELNQCKRAIRVFLRTAYTDERLTWLLAHARSGQLVYYSCCCLVGVATADHPLVGKVTPKQLLNSSHYALARTFLGAAEAERAFYLLGLIGKGPWISRDELRRRRIIPMVLAELWRRSRSKREAPEELGLEAPPLEASLEAARLHLFLPLHPRPLARVQEKPACR